jgi:hypothetical protein
MPPERARVRYFCVWAGGHPFAHLAVSSRGVINPGTLAVIRSTGWGRCEVPGFSCAPHCSDRGFGRCPPGLLREYCLWPRSSNG